MFISKHRETDTHTHTGETQRKKGRDREFAELIDKDLDFSKVALNCIYFLNPFLISL